MKQLWVEKLCMNKEQYIYGLPVSVRSMIPTRTSRKPRVQGTWAAGSRGLDEDEDRVVGSAIYSN